jgi:teichuronic acid biosynthesis glycosyltransferase TuaC
MRVTVLTVSGRSGENTIVEVWARRQALAAGATGVQVDIVAPRTPLALTLRALRRRRDFDLLHVHGIAAAQALRRARLDVPVVVSVYGSDVFGAAERSDAPGAANPGEPVPPTACPGLSHARLTLAASEGAAALARARGARETRVVHLGAELPTRTPRSLLGASDLGRPAMLVTAGRLSARKRHADVLRALAVLAERHPGLRYLVIGAGPEQIAIEGLACRLGVAERVQITGALPQQQTIERVRSCTVFVMPSTEEAFGVAYLEAMAAGVPAIGCRGEPGPEEIAAAGDGFVLVPPGDVERLCQRIDELISDPHRLREAGQHARETVSEHFTWKQCGEQTAQAYADALR